MSPQGRVAALAERPEPASVPAGGLHINHNFRRPFFSLFLDPIKHWLGFCPVFLPVPSLAFPRATLCSPEAVRCLSPSPPSVPLALICSAQDPGMFLGQELGTSP